MKRTLLFACVVAAMASCSKNEVADVNTQDPNIINFNSYVGASTKAGEITTANISEAGVYASTTKGNLATPFIPNTKIEEEGTTGVWNTSSPYNWPSDGSTVYFYAYSPFYGAAESKGDITSAGVLPNYPQVKATAAEQVDIVAEATTGTKDANAAGVDLTFDHMLSKVDFNVVVKSATDRNLTLTVQDFTLVGVEGTHVGLDIVTPKLVEAASFTAQSYTYDAAAATAAFTLSADATTTSATKDLNVAGTDTPEAFMLLPQTLLEWAPSNAGVTGADVTGAAVKMNYKLQQNGVYVVGGASEYATAYFPLPTTTAWEAGKSYVYAITFDAADLGDGGYKPEPDPKDPTDPKDPILGDGSQIKFINVTVSNSWDTVTSTQELNPTI